MTPVVLMLYVSLAMLSVALIFAVVRLKQGPTALDRAVAVDVFAATVIAIVIILIVLRARTDLGALLIIFVLTAFFSTVSVARFVSSGIRRRPRGRVMRPSGSRTSRDSLPAQTQDDHNSEGGDRQ